MSFGESGCVIRSEIRLSPCRGRCGTRIVRERFRSLAGRAASGRDLPPIVAHPPTSPSRADRLRETACHLQALVDTDCDELVVHAFIRSNPCILIPFMCDRILNEAPMLTMRKTDFTVLTAAGEMWLIELERPSLPLIKEDGYRNAHLNHAIEQTEKWRHVLEEHRHAVLSCLRLRDEEVACCKVAVIGGRSASCTREELNELKSVLQRNSVTFYTYDDLVAILMSQAEKL